MSGLGALEFKFLTELKRRSVFRVSAAYLGTAWFLVHVGTVLGETFEPLHHAMPFVIAAVAAGLPILLVGTWLFELTPNGFRLVRRPTERRSATPARAGRTLDLVIVGVMVLAVAALALDRWLLHRPFPRLRLITPFSLFPDSTLIHTTFTQDLRNARLIAGSQDAFTRTRRAATCAVRLFACATR